MVTLKYLKIRFTTFQCPFVGFCIDRKTLLTLYANSGLVIVTCCKTRTKLLYNWASLTGTTILGTNNQGLNPN